VRSGSFAGGEAVGGEDTGGGSEEGKFRQKAGHGVGGEGRWAERGGREGRGIEGVVALESSRGLNRDEG